MECRIGGKSYFLATGLQNDSTRRAAFDKLAQRVFGLSFEAWHSGGWWTDRYQPYTLFDGEKAAANLSVSRMDFRLDGEEKLFVQLGTVMTAPEYRGLGLSRWLMERVLGEWTEQCDLVYLFANSGVLDFYPRFGLRRAEERQAALILSPAQEHPVGMRRLNMGEPEDRKLLLSHYDRSNPFSQFAMEGNPGLLMFYCTQFLRDCVWYAEAADAVLVAEQQEDVLLCHDVFGGEQASLMDLLASVAAPGTGTAVLGFTPKPASAACSFGPLREKNDFLFVLGRDAERLSAGNRMFPLLSHA